MIYKLFDMLNCEARTISYLLARFVTSSTGDGHGSIELFNKWLKRVRNESFQITTLLYNTVYRNDSLHLTGTTPFLQTMAPHLFKNGCHSRPMTLTMDGGRTHREMVLAPADWLAGFSLPTVQQIYDNVYTVYTVQYEEFAKASPSISVGLLII